MTDARQPDCVVEGQRSTPSQTSAKSLWSIPPNFTPRSRQSCERYIEEMNRDPWTRGLRMWRGVELLLRLGEARGVVLSIPEKRGNLDVMSPPEVLV
jgi:hypothetical protein